LRDYHSLNLFNLHFGAQPDRRDGKTIYDGLGVFAKICKFFKQLPWAYYCSEAVISGLQMQGLLLGISAQSTPAALRNYVRYNLGWRQVVKPT
ncbi:MAG: hypothetical protein ACTSUK_03145, partial [Promethearchaeota archaeon]